MSARENVIHIEVDPEIKRKIRLSCIDTGETISEWVITAIRERLNKKESKSK